MIEGALVSPEIRLATVAAAINSSTLSDFGDTARYPSLSPGIESDFDQEYAMIVLSYRSGMNTISLST